MLIQKKTLVFNKENDNCWYVECKKWEEEQTKLFRETHLHLDKEGKIVPYEKELQLDNPLDDHTKHEEWRDPHADLAMDDSFGKMLDQMAAGKKIVTIEMLSYGWVCNTFTHYRFVGLDLQVAEYELRFDTGLPAHIRLTPIFRYIFDSNYPLHLHVKAVAF